MKKILRDAFEGWCARNGFTPATELAEKHLEAALRKKNGGYTLTVRVFDIPEQERLGLGRQFPLGSAPVTEEKLLAALALEWKPEPLNEAARRMYERMVENSR